MTSLALVSFGLLDRGSKPALAIAVEGYLAAANQNTRPDADSGTFWRRAHLVEGESALRRSIQKLWARHEPKRSEPKAEQRRAAKALVSETREILHPLLADEWSAPAVAEIDVVSETFVEDPFDSAARAAFVAKVADFIAHVEMMRREEEIAVAMLLAA